MQQQQSAHRRMRPGLSLALLLVAAPFLLLGHFDRANASLGRLVRQASESEQEATTARQPASPDAGQQQTTQQPPGRLYPDIPKQPNFVPPFNGVGPHHYPAISHHHGQTPFVPFGIQIPVSRLNADQQPAPFGRVLPQPRPMTPAERLQSQSFANGLGRRLLSMIGIETNNSTSNDGDRNAADQRQQTSPAMMEEMMRALQNSTVLQQLNKGVNTIYGGLSKMYNSTVQEQLNLLQERLKSETLNSTNPWHQRMAEQVPQFFKQMASKVGEAQDQLNKVWHDVSQVAQGNSSVLHRSANDQPQPSFFNSFDQFISSGSPAQGDFFNNIGRSLGFGGPQQPQMMAQQSARPHNGQQQGQADLGEQLREFWYAQVQPQIGVLRNQVALAWRDLTASGALAPETIVRSRSSHNQGSATQNGSSSLVDEILKEVDMNGSEYTLIEPTNGGGGEQGLANDVSKPTPQTPNETGIKLSPQMQNRLIAMQRELNQLWMGLTNSLQGAITNVRNTINPTRGPQFAPTINAMASTNAPDPVINEIDGKVKDLSKLQRDADMVYETVQQQQREAQQRQTFGDRFKNFFNNMNVDMGGVNQLPDRIGQSFNRFGNVVGDLWNQIPERWDNFRQNMRPQQHQQQQNEIRAMMKSSTTTSTTTEGPKPER